MAAPTGVLVTARWCVTCSREIELTRGRPGPWDETSLVSRRASHPVHGAASANARSKLAVVADSLGPECRQAARLGRILKRGCPRAERSPGPAMGSAASAAIRSSRIGITRTDHRPSTA
jgi:hypothetical protein